MRYLRATQSSQTEIHQTIQPIEYYQLFMVARLLRKSKIQRFLRELT